MRSKSKKKKLKFSRRVRNNTFVLYSKKWKKKMFFEIIVTVLSVKTRIRLRRMYVSVLGQRSDYAFPVGIA